MATYRVGNHQPQNLYRDDAYIGVMFTAEDAALVVEALHHVEHAHGPALPIVVARYPAFPAEVIASALAPIKHQAETPGGDGLGYGKCTGCGELWPCKTSRSQP